MRFLVSIEASWPAGERLDSQPGDPGKLFGHIAERYQPEAFYVEAGRRKAWWVIDFKDEAAVTEFAHLSIWQAGSYPEFTPVLTGEQAAKVVPDAIEHGRQFA